MIRSKQINWNYVMLVFVLVAILMVAGCGGSNDETPAASGSGGSAAEEPASSAPAIEGELHETERVSMIIAGADHLENDVFTGMVDSIEFK